MGGTHFDLREIHQIGKRTREFLIHPNDCAAFERHHINLAGISIATTGFRFARRRPGMGQALVCFAGEGFAWVEGKWKKCRAGMAYVTPPGSPHAYRAGKRWHVGWVTYSDPALFPMKTPALLEADPRPLEYSLKGLHQEIMTQRDAALLEHWAELLHHHVMRIIEPRQPARLWKVWERVQADLAFAWDLQRLAQLACLGAEHLRRVCLRETGHSPMQHVAHLRMRHAVSLLSMGHKVETAARSVGYENAFAFASAFKRIMRHRPSEFRRRPHFAGR